MKLFLVICIAILSIGGIFKFLHYCYADECLIIGLIGIIIGLPIFLFKEFSKK